jgi:hypothetical protein
VTGRRTRRASEEGSGGAAKGLRGNVLGEGDGGRWAACASRPGDGNRRKKIRHPIHPGRIEFKKKLAHLQTKIMEIAPYGSFF